MRHYLVVIGLSVAIWLILGTWRAIDQTEIQIASRLYGLWAISVLWWGNCWMTRMAVGLFERYHRV